MKGLHSGQNFINMHIKFTLYKHGTTNATYIASCSNFLRSIEMLECQITSATKWSNFFFLLMYQFVTSIINYVSQSWCLSYSIQTVQYATELRIYIVTDFFSITFHFIFRFFSVVATGELRI